MVKLEKKIGKLGEQVGESDGQSLLKVNCAKLSADKTFAFVVKNMLSSRLNNVEQSKCVKRKTFFAPRILTRL